MLKITTQLITQEIAKRGWKFEIIDERKTFYRFWDDKNKEYLLRSNTSAKTSAVAYLYANNKSATNFLATDVGVAIPQTHVCDSLEQAKEFLEKHKTVVVKPIDSAHGNGVTVGIQDEIFLQDAIKYAKQYSQNIILQEFVAGDDYRLLFIGGKFVAAAIREPASVVGNGIDTIEELILKENKNPDRGVNYQTKLNIIDLASAKRFLGDKVKDVLNKDEKIFVVGTANVGKGGLSIDVTDTVEPKMLELGRQIIEKVGLGLCGIDFIYAAKQSDHTPPKLIELNASPTFGLHHFPAVGQSRNVTKSFIDWLVLG